VTVHKQPNDTVRTVAKMHEIARRSGPHGFDALGVVVLDLRNDGTPAQIVADDPTSAPTDDFYYDHMVARAGHLYDSSFGQV